MANGGWYGTQEEWERLERPLLLVDPIIEKFAADHQLTISKNYKDWPERSVAWNDGPGCLIQLYLDDEKALTWKLWLCCSEDRGNQRFWKNEFLINGESVPSFSERLAELLAEGYGKLRGWQAHPEQLEYATTIAHIPDSWRDGSAR
jgi:hypothetical protein